MTNAEKKQYYDLRETWGKLTNAGRKVPAEILDRLRELTAIKNGK
jgi:predicted membrane chloride channel (bestrophin family)